MLNHLIKGKKGKTDLIIMITIFVILVFTSVIMNSISESFPNQTPDQNIDDLIDDPKQELNKDNIITSNWWDILQSFIKIIFWNFDGFPQWLSLIYDIMMAIWILLLIRLFRGI